MRRAWPAFAPAFGLLYLATLFPSLSSYRDSGDLASAARSLGIAHPPGYPLYVLLGRLWISVLPFGGPAYRLNVLSALCGALAAALFARFLLRAFPERPGAALAAGISAAAAPCLWALSQVSEMYALNALFAASLASLWPLEELDEASVGRRLRLAALLSGLGLAGHESLVLILPATAWAFRRAPRRDWAAAAVYLLAGAAVVLYLPLRGSAGPARSWGDPTRPAGLWRLLTRADYGGLRLHPERAAGFGEAGAGLALSLRAFAGQLGPVALALAALGSAAAFRRGREPARLCLAAFVLSGPLFIVWASLDPARADSLPILEPHLILPVLFAAALAAAGAAELPAGLRGAAALALALQAAWVGARSFGVKDHRSSFEAPDHVAGLAASLPPDAVLFSPDDPTAFGLSYASEARDFRPDIVPIVGFQTRWGYEVLRRAHPELLGAEDIPTSRELVATLISRNWRRGVYVDLPQKAPNGYDARPVGMAYRLWQAEEGPEDARQLDFAEDRLELARHRPSGSGLDFFSSHELTYEASALTNLGVALAALGQTARAERLYERSLALGSEPGPAWNNWANLAFDNGDYAKARARYRLAIAAADRPQFHYNLGRAAFAAGDLDEAKREYENVLAGGSYPPASNDLALIWLRQGEVERALGVFEKLSGEGYKPAQYNLGLALEKAGRKAEAAVAFQSYFPNASDADRPALRRRIAELLR